MSALYVFVKTYPLVSKCMKSVKRFSKKPPPIYPTAGPTEENAKKMAEKGI